MIWPVDLAAQMAASVWRHLRSFKPFSANLHQQQKHLQVVLKQM